MRKVGLGVFDRIVILDIIRARSGQIKDIDELNSSMKILDLVEFSDDEANTIGLTSDASRITWKPGTEFEKETEFSDKQFSLLESLIRAKDNWILDVRNIELCSKFGIETQD